jgi:hypothetical protein
MSEPHDKVLVEAFKGILDAIATFADALRRAHEVQALLYQQMTWMIDRPEDEDEGRSLDEKITEKLDALKQHVLQFKAKKQDLGPRSN